MVSFQFFLNWLIRYMFLLNYADYAISFDWCLLLIDLYFINSDALFNILNRLGWCGVTILKTWVPLNDFTDSVTAEKAGLGPSAALWYNWKSWTLYFVNLRSFFIFLVSLVILSDFTVVILAGLITGKPAAKLEISHHCQWDSR